MLIIIFICSYEQCFFCSYEQCINIRAKVSCFLKINFIFINWSFLNSYSYGTSWYQLAKRLKLCLHFPNPCAQHSVIPRKILPHKNNYNNNNNNNKQKQNNKNAKHRPRIYGYWIFQQWWYYHLAIVMILIP